MKKIIILSILGFIVCSAFTTGILQDKKTPALILTDYRDAYTGVYFCNVTCNRLSGDVQERDITSDTISINITKDAVDSILKINFSKQIVKIKLLSKAFEPYPKGGYYGGRFFAQDSINFSFSQGRSTSCNYAGKKV